MRRLGRLIAFLFLVLFLTTGAIYYYQRQKAEANATPRRHRCRKGSPVPLTAGNGPTPWTASPWWRSLPANTG